MTAKKPINIYEAKTHFSKLCDQAASGDDVVIARHGQPWVRITALKGPNREIKFGVMKGKIRIAADFDAPLPDDILGLFEGEEE